MVLKFELQPNIWNINWNNLDLLYAYMVLIDYIENADLAILNVSSYSHNLNQHYRQRILTLLENKYKNKWIFLNDYL